MLYTAVCNNPFLFTTPFCWPPCNQLPPKEKPKKPKKPKKQATFHILIKPLKSLPIPLLLDQASLETSQICQPPDGTAPRGEFRGRA